MNRAIVFGAYGVFGGHVARQLSSRGVPLTVAGRSLAKAEEFARTLGGDCRAAVADLTQPEACRKAIEGHAVVANCAGPFNQLGVALLDACLEAGCHYCDITDNRAYATLVRGYDERFRQRRLAAVYGCSSLPGISGALALYLAKGLTQPVERVRATLFIGNNNQKGNAAVGSLLAGLGRPIIAPQGTLRGFRDREVVPLPPPFGRRAVFNFESPDYDLFPMMLGAKSVSVKVGFELRLATYAFALMARLGIRYGSGLAKWLELPGKSLGWMGCSGGAVMTELFLADGSERRAAVAGAKDGQQMAALPCALVAEALCREPNAKPGVATAYDFLGAEPLLAGLVAAGYGLHSPIKN